MNDIRTGQPKEGDTIIAMSSCMESKLFPYRFANSTAIDKKNFPLYNEQNTNSSNENNDSKCSRQYLRRYQRYREIEKRINLAGNRRTENIIPINNIMLDRELLDKQRPNYNVEDLLQSYKNHAKRKQVSFNDVPSTKNSVTNKQQCADTDYFRNIRPIIDTGLKKRDDITPSASHFTNNTSNAVKGMLKNAKEKSNSGSQAIVSECEKLRTINLLQNGYKDTRLNLNEKFSALNQSEKSAPQLLNSFNETESDDKVFHLKSETLRKISKNQIDLDSYKENEFKLSGWSKVREGVEKDLNQFKTVLENSCQVNTLDIVSNCSLTKSQLGILSKDENLYQVFMENRLKSVNQANKISEMSKRINEYEEKISLMSKEIGNLKQKLECIDIASKTKDLTIMKQNYFIQDLKKSNTEINNAMQEVGNIMDLYPDQS